MSAPLMDPLRGEILRAARAAARYTDGSYERDEVTVSALSFADVSSISAPLWNEAHEMFACLVIALEIWDQLAERQDGPWDQIVAVEEEVRCDHWDEDRWARCQVINAFIDEIILGGIWCHLDEVAQR